MSRNNLSTKKANMLSAARKSSTSNPFIVNDFYDVIEKHISDENLKPEQVWNLDESGFPTDPSRSKVISPRGEVGYKITWAAGPENISTLAAVNAAGRVLDPLIIFAGKNFQSTWKGEEALPNTMYGISSNGWMTTGVFFEWFQKFAEQVEERPLVVVYDGHLSHVSVELIELAINEKITLIKLPPHVTDKLQPLDVCCFGPLKREWERLLSTRINVLGPRESITKSKFVDLLCSIWHKGLSPKNAMSGFRATGIYPVDRTKYPTERYDPRLVKRYEKWAKLGKPEDIMEDLATSIQTPKKLREAEEETTLPEPEITETETQINQSQSSTGPSTPALASTPTVSNKGAGSRKA